MLKALREKINTIKSWVIEQVIWAEHSLKDLNGPDKKAAIVKKIDDMIKLPIWLEWADGPVISWLVDKTCSLMNEKMGHNWGKTTLDETIKHQLVRLLPDPVQPTKR